MSLECGRKQLERIRQAREQQEQPQPSVCEATVLHCCTAVTKEKIIFILPVKGFLLHQCLFPATSLKGSVSATEQCHFSEVNTPERQKVPEVRQTVNIFGELLFHHKG